jgi:crotonobetainyl-CoA:carnitine CoA-transferase CaiB-like acyl-CoA transferase
VTAGSHLGEYDAGMQAAIASVAALYAREVWGVGQHVDISKQEAALALNRLLLAQFLGQGRRTDRSRTYEYGGIYSCRDGYVILYPREDQHWQALATIMEQPDLGHDDRFRTRADRIQHGAEVNSVLAEWAATLDKEDIYYRVAPSGCPSAYFATAEEVLASPQLAARGFFKEIDHPRAGRLSYASLPFALSGAGDLPQVPAPLLGQHNELVFCQELGITPRQLAELRRGRVI